MAKPGKVPPAPGASVTKPGVGKTVKQPAPKMPPKMPNNNPGVSGRGEPSGMGGKACPGC